MKVEVLVLADHQLHSADNVVGRGIAHGCVPIVPIEAREVSISPTEEDCVMLDRLKKRAEDQRRVLLLLSREAVERVKRIGGDGEGKSEAGLLAIIIVDKVKLHDPWKGLLLVFCAVLAAVSCLGCVVPHDVRVDNTALGFSSTSSGALMMNEEEAWLLICVVGAFYALQCEVGQTSCSGLRMGRSRVVE